jgi:adhesin transport system membrane fusion protein
MTHSNRHRDGLSSLILVESPPSLRVLAKMLIALLVFFLLAMILTPWQQNVAGSGRVVAFEPFDRIQSIAAPVSGRVRQAWVMEGSRVEAGDRLLEIVDNDPAILERLQAQREALGAQLEAARSKFAIYDSQIEALEIARRLAMESAESRVQMAIAGVESARIGRDAARAAAQQAMLNFDRQRELLEEGLTSDLEFEMAERVHLEAQARLDQAHQAWSAAGNDERASRADLGRVDTEARARVDTARAGRQSASVDAAALQERLAHLESRIAQQSTQLITAPRSGTIMRLHAAPGAQLVHSGDPLVSLIPDTASRAVELWVDGNNVPLIEKGRRVRLQFEGWPAVQFAGWPSVAVGTFGGEVALVDPSADAAGRFRLLVVPDPLDAAWPEPQYLRQGARANGWVLLDSVSLGYELWRQANDFPPTVAFNGSSEASSPEQSAPESRGMGS